MAALLPRHQRLFHVPRTTLDVLCLAVSVHSSFSGPNDMSFASASSDHAEQRIRGRTEYGFPLSLVLECRKSTDSSNGLLGNDHLNMQFETRHFALLGGAITL